jgi:hypothetical protein
MCVFRYVTYIEQKGKCIISYCGRPCDEVAKRVWPIKISDGAQTTLFNKGFDLILLHGITVICVYIIVALSS